MSGLTKFLMQEVEMPLVEIVADMEDTGYSVDVQFFNDLRAQLEPKAEKARANIRKVAGDDDFNPNSDKQLADLLYKKLQLKVLARTKKGSPSTTTQTLGWLKSKHEIILEILSLKKLNKIISTYCRIPDQVDADGRLRVEFNQLAAETGRFTSPSVIQTIPKENDEYGLRKGFCAREGFTIVGADFRQQELNVLAQVSGDKNLLKAIKTGLDLHGLAAIKVFGLDCEPNEVEAKYPEKRGQIKAIQFGLIYGKTAHGLAASLGISKDEAQQLIDDYFKQFPAISKFVSTIHRDLLRQGYVDDVFGRRRYFLVVKKKVPRKKYQQMTEQERELLAKIGKAKRAAQNFVIQGASATITKLAMIRCYHHITEKYGNDIKMILTLHDELQFEVRDDLVPGFAAELPGLMCELGLERFAFKLPLAVEVKAGPSWGEMSKWKGNEGSKDGDTNTVKG
jgi:DNA polymerase-1